jgi:hypothetical protein
MMARVQKRIPSLASGEGEGEGKISPPHLYPLPQTEGEEGAAVSKVPSSSRL